MGRRTAFPGLSQQGLSPVPVSGPSVGAQTRTWARKAAPEASAFLPPSPEPRPLREQGSGSGAQWCLGAADLCPLLRSPERRRLLVPVAQTQLPESLSCCLPERTSHAVVHFRECILCAEHWARSPRGKATEARAWPWGAQSPMGDTYVKTQNPGSAEVLFGHTGDRSPKGRGQVPAGLWRPCVASATFLPL